MTLIFFRKYKLILALASLLFSISCDTFKQEKPQEISLQRYLIGVKALELADSLEEKQKVHYYSQLVKITGMNAEKALTIIEKQYADPKSWEGYISSSIKALKDTLFDKE